MSTKGVPGIPLAAMAAGGILVWSGLYNVTITNTIGSLLKGQAPAKGPAQQLVAPAASSTSGGGTAAAGDTSAHNAGAAANQSTAKLLAAPYGWSTGQNWTDLVYLWNQESGWSNTIANPSSGAYGIAQALPPTKYPAAGQASGGSSASAQISWGLQYIQQTYGSPSAAWAHEKSAGWY